ncbi:2-amino-3-carboxymuconate-6-semialdehyde decarboxylase [Fusarium oxysporum f. sp. albedinis]|nr:hypothetical protein HZ326_21647 [Fusarium oxysporum f. sp. albedinis]KAJ0135832.1 2-amino-3-carboxymuconate-6-semialdehyde decarboxylase [Fusarium oxysporum f. sp. albedinis]
MMKRDVTVMMPTRIINTANPIKTATVGWLASADPQVRARSNWGRAVASRAPVRMIYMVIIHNAKVHMAARTEKGHLVRPTLGPPNIPQLGTSPATLQLATSARLHLLRKWRMPATIHEATRRYS